MGQEAGEELKANPDFSQFVSTYFPKHQERLKALYDRLHNKRDINSFLYQINNLTIPADSTYVNSALFYMLLKMLKGNAALNQDPNLLLNPSLSEQVSSILTLFQQALSAETQTHHSKSRNRLLSFLQQTATQENLHQLSQVQLQTVVAILVNPNCHMGTVRSSKEKLNSIVDLSLACNKPDVLKSFFGYRTIAYVFNRLPEQANQLIQNHPEWVMKMAQNNRRVCSSLVSFIKSTKLFNAPSQLEQHIPVMRSWFGQLNRRSTRQVLKPLFNKLGLFANQETHQTFFSNLLKVNDEDAIDSTAVLQLARGVLQYSPKMMLAFIKNNHLASAPIKMRHIIKDGQSERIEPLPQPPQNTCLANLVESRQFLGELFSHNKDNALQIIEAFNSSDDAQHTLIKAVLPLYQRYLDKSSELRREHDRNASDSLKQAIADVQRTQAAARISSFARGSSSLFAGLPRAAFPAEQEFHQSLAVSPVGA